MDLAVITLGASLVAFAAWLRFRHQGKQQKARLNIDPSLNVGRRKDDDVGGEA